MRPWLRIRFDFQVWEGLTRDMLEVEGRAILRRDQSLIDKIVEEAVLVEFEGETVPAVYSPVMASQIGERLCQGFPFCLIWHERDGLRYFSLRSKPGTRRRLRCCLPLWGRRTT